ncbi:FecCD family ABC transporter permease [Granulosicoccus antarcticus]|uniref:Hemin transport system permease protein HmuU n=1 Tax=Granulosicoccus antarcticus IMCC3135 TaxID=1192854 RepID=A0A2Z2PAI5_9GAMM|nr:iron ABC transporter permease [Granulosicoccus antarcticus]ASJ76884.1 Hemin transport system permease protein HmuU [Granulosicoccus antarcticus IMCC3135]
MSSHSGTLLHRLLLPVLVLTLLVVVVLALAVGAVPVPMHKVVGVLLSGAGLPLDMEFTSTEAAVVQNIRLPRVLMGLLVGGSLAVCGAALQGLFRNPLADPALVGVSSGAALGAVSVIVLSQGILQPLAQLLGLYLLPLAAFIGGVVTTLIVYRLAQSERGVPVATLLLAGIAIGALSGAGTGLLTYLSDDFQLRTLTFWTMGSLGGATWSKLGVAAVLMLLSIMLIPTQARALNAILLGESEAMHLGFDLERVKRRLIVLVALGVGAAVSVSGIIGFLGLVTPHLIRLLVGPDHRQLLPASALAGAILLLLADLFARTVVAPSELPIGIVTALVGGPFFLWLLIRFRNQGSVAA